MAQMHKSPENKHNEYSDHAYVSPLQNLRNLNSSGGIRNKEQNKSSNNLMSDHSITDNLGSDNSRQFSAQGPHKYRITTSTGGLRSPGHQVRENRANAVYGEGRGYLDPLAGAQSIRGISGSGEKDAGKTESKYMKIDRERLYEEGLQLKKQLNSLQDENTRLKTKNAILEKEAVKFEKMFQEASTKPNKKNKQSVKAEGLDVPTLKQHIRDLKSELDDRDSELTGLKKKAKVTKIHELEVQLQALQDETFRLRAYAEAIVAKKTDNIIQEGEKHLVRVQNAEAIRLKKELDALQHANRTYELKCQDYQAQLASKEEKFKREQAHSHRIAQNKERELVKLRSQLVGFTATSAPAGKDADKKGTEKASGEGQIKKEVERMTTENHSLKSNLEGKDSEIAKLEKHLKEIESKIEIKPSSSKEFLLGKPEHHEHAHAHHAQPHHTQTTPRKEAKPELKEEEVKKVISNPSYQAQKTPVEEPKKEPIQHAPVEKKEAKPVNEEKPVQKPVVEPKVSADDAKKIAYHINLSFRVKGVPFEAIEKLDWKKQAQSDGSLGRDQIVKILKNDIFGLSEKEVTLLAQYLLQENHPKDGKTTDIDGVKATLTGLMGPLPYWDDEMKKKLHSSISKICTEYRETLTEALSLISNGKHLTRKHLEEAAEAVEVSLNFAQLEYIITKLYERSGDANSLAISDLFDIFYVEEQKSKPTPDTKAAQPKESPKKEKGKKVEEKPAKDTKEKKKTISNEEDAVGIYEDDDEFDDDDHKLSDEEDGEKYESLFPPEGEEKNEKITERGEEEEDDEEYKEDEYEEEENKEEIVKPKVEVKSKQKEEEEDEYGDDAYEEEEEEEKPKAKAKEEVKKSSMASVPKSGREEVKKSKQTEEEEEEYEERRPSNASKKSGEVVKAKKNEEENDYEEEEYEAEFPDEDDQ